MSENKNLKFKIVSKFKNLIFEENIIFQFLTLTLVSSLLLSSFQLLNETELNKIKFSKDDLILLMSGVASVFTLFVLVLTYLNKTRNKVQAASRNSLSYNQIKAARRMQVELIRLRELTSTTIDDDSQNEIRKIIDSRIGDFAFSETIEKIKKKIASDDKTKKYVDIISTSSLRIKSEIESLESRGNLNLSIGIVATVIGIIMLGTFVFTANYEADSPSKFIYHFIPRLSLVVFVQIFALFFLRLYKANMNEIKYYHKELTSVEARASAVAIAVESGNAESVAKVISDLSSLDRNSNHSKQFSTEIDQSTEALTKLLNAVAPFINNK